MAHRPASSRSSCSIGTPSGCGPAQASSWTSASIRGSSSAAPSRYAVEGSSDAPEATIQAIATMAATGRFARPCCRPAAWPRFAPDRAYGASFGFENEALRHDGSLIPVG